MNPISNQVFSYDSEKYVYQKDGVVPVVNQAHLPAKPFKLTPPDKSKKSKRDLEKEKQQKGNKRPFDMMSGS